MGKLYFLAFIILTLGFQLSAQNSTASWQQKISQDVYKNIDDSLKTEVLIVFKVQAELSFAKSLTTKAKKGEYVYKKLRETAVIHQKQLVQWLENNDVIYRPYWIVNLIYAYASIEQIEFLAQHESVKSIIYNFRLTKEPPVKLQGGNERKPEVTTWGIEKINADDVWDLGFSGQGVVVGGQDTGYDWDHEALINKYRGWNGSSADHNYNWHDAIHEINPNNNGDNPCGLDSPEPCDDHYHGTHTMGTMVGGYSTFEIGVAPDAQWIGCRNMERGWGTPETYLECFEWFLAPTDLNDEFPNPSLAPHVINNSWTCPPEEGCDGDYDFGIMETAIENLQDAGIVVVVSAGNEGPSCSTIENPPAFYPSSYSVGATNSSDIIANFSSRGPTSGYGAGVLKPDVSAPGVSVYSAEPDDQYGTHSGTSMAGPHVAGAVALLISAIPELEGNVIAIEEILEQTAEPLTTTQSCGGVSGSEIPNNTYGWGRINILAAIDYAYEYLPLEIISFNGEHFEGTNKLYWSIENTENETLFEIEKSNDNANWFSIGTVSISDSEDYNYVDNNPFPGTNYYRLKIIDWDGLYRYSHYISVHADIKIITDLYPNPVVNNKMHLIFDARNFTVASLDISGIDGKKHFYYDLKEYPYKDHIEIDFYNLNAGVYILQVYNDSGNVIEHFKVVKL